MSAKLSNELRKKLLKLLRAKSAEESDADELFSVLLQISLAVMLIFMIAFVLFMSVTGGDIRKVEAMKQELQTARQDKLMQALDRVKTAYKIRYRLNFFMEINPADGKVDFLLRSLLADPVLANEYKLGFTAAAADYADVKTLRGEYFKQTLVFAKLTAAELTPVENAWLVGEIDGSVTQLAQYLDGVQKVALIDIQERLIANPAQIRDEEIKKWIDLINRTDDVELKRMRLDWLNRKLESYALEQLSEFTQMPVWGGAK